MTTTNRMPHLPREIIDAIIDQMQTDTKSLSDCSLVSKQWLARARHWAFEHRQARLISRSSTPDSRATKRDAHRFIELLHAPHSTLPPFIQFLVVTGPDFGYECPLEDYDVLNALISEHLPLLSNLRTIAISYVTWRCLRPESKALIGSLPQVTSVIWQGITVESPHDLVRFCSTSFSRLQALKIREIHVAEPEAQHVRPPSSPGRSSPRLRILDVATDAVLRPLLSLPSMSIQPQNIDTLCLGRVSINHMPLVRRFIEAAGPGLRHIALDIARSATEAEASGNCALILSYMSYDSFLNMQITVTPASSISFHANPNLRSLEITTFDLRPPTPCNTSWLQAIITTITSHSFEDITLWFGATGKTEWLERFDFQSLERSLLQRVDPLALPILHTKFVITWTDNHWLVAAVEGQLLELHKRGLLVVYPTGRILSKALDGWSPYVW
jgi:hypothetical protein